MQTNKPLFRTNDAAATAVMERLIPQGKVRRRIAEIFAASCEHAHVQAPAGWELTLSPAVLRLNVGQVALLDVVPGLMFLATVLPLPRLPREVKRLDRNPVYPAVPIRSAGLVFQPSDVTALSRDVLLAHRYYIEEAASRKRTSPFRSAHSPAAVRVLSEWSKKPIPQPTYELLDDLEPDVGRNEIPEVISELANAAEVEKAAIRITKEWYETRGWRVVSVESEHLGYDLRCTRKGDERHVEVKGRARSGDTLLLTANEWTQAVKDARFFISVASNISGNAPSLQQWSGLQFQQLHKVSPIVYRASRRHNT